MHVRFETELTAGNEYEISNLSQETEAELFFAQARKIRMNEADETAFERLQAQVRARSASLAASEKPPSRDATREASEDDAEEATPKGKRRARAY
jgi:centromere protein C